MSQTLNYLIIYQTDVVNNVLLPTLKRVLHTNPAIILTQAITRLVQIPERIPCLKVNLILLNASKVHSDQSIEQKMMN